MNTKPKTRRRDAEQHNNLGKHGGNEEDTRSAAEYSFRKRSCQVTSKKEVNKNNVSSPSKKRRAKRKHVFELLTQLKTFIRSILFLEGFQPCFIKCVFQTYLFLRNKSAI